MFVPRTRKIDTKDSSVIDVIYYMSTFKEQTLFVQFNNGAMYTYDDVPFKHFKSLRSANRRNKSVGSLFNDLVKKSGYAYRKISRWSLLMQENYTKQQLFF